MKNFKSQIQLPTPRRLFLHGKRVFDTSTVIGKKVDSEGRLHAIGEPALCFDDGAEEHWVHGRLQSPGESPALYISTSNSCLLKVCSWNGCTNHEKLNLTPDTHVWCEDGFIHRDGAPAVFNYGDEDDYFEEWWSHGLRHRQGAPAVITSDHCLWFQNGLMHREDGPALDFESPEYSRRVQHPRTSKWYWHGREMLGSNEFRTDFDYGLVPAKFVLSALAFCYSRCGCSKLTPEALRRASMAFPELLSLLEAAEAVGLAGQDVAQRINAGPLATPPPEAYLINDLLDLENLQRDLA